MSSILEALKKVEKESPKLDFTPDLTKGVDTRKAVSRRARTTRIVYRIATSLVVLIVVAVGAWLALAHPELFRKSAVVHNPAPAVKQEAPVTASVNSPANATAVEKTVEVPKVEVPKVDVPEEMPAQAPEVKIAKTVAQETQAPKPILEEKSGSIETSKEPSKQLSKEVRESHPDDAKFKLEAIVWAESPESRFAVINGQIVRAGGSMEGVSVTAIARDHVAVRSSGREWKLMFVAE